MNPPDDRLYRLLPYYYRTLDEKEHGLALRDLMGVMAEPFTVVENDIAQMYDDWFIETCADWAVPYLGDLAGWQPVESPVPAESSEAALLRWLAPRRDVANTLRHRRRKGTLPLLVELARDVAGWPALAVEAGFKEWLLARTAEVHRHRGAANAPATGSPAFADVHDPLALQWLGTPRDTFAHHPDVHRGAPGLNLSSVALHVWRLQAFRITCTRAASGNPPRPSSTPASPRRKKRSRCGRASWRSRPAPKDSPAPECSPASHPAERPSPLATVRGSCMSSSPCCSAG